MTYGKRLDAALTHAKKSRKELAEHIGQSPQSVGMVINGKNDRLSTEASAKAAAYLRVDHNWLVTGRGTMIPSVAPVAQPLSPEAQRLGEWLDKIKDPEKHYRTAHAAMAVLIRVIDGPPTDTSRQRRARKEKPHDEHSKR